MSGSCRLIIAAFASEANQSRLAEVEPLLRSMDLVVSRTEMTHRGLLVFAESHDCDSLNLLGLREKLQAQGRSYGLDFRLQREELFRAMHQLSSPFGQLP